MLSIFYLCTRTHMLRISTISTKNYVCESIRVYWNLLLYSFVCYVYFCVFLDIYYTSNIKYKFQLRSMCLVSDLFTYFSHEVFLLFITTRSHKIQQHFIFLVIETTMYEKLSVKTDSTKVVLKTTIEFINLCSYDISFLVNRWLKLIS